jgi:bacillithiol biosynthesis deacetylase BshB2
LQPIRPAEVEAALRRLVGETVYLHLETTAGAYTEGGFGAFIRNAALRLRSAAVRGTGPFRAGLETELGWVYAEGLTHWEVDAAGRLLLAGYDAEGRVTVVCELAGSPFPVAPAPRRLRPATVPATVVPGVQPPTPERAVLAVLAHPDDETFGCAGRIALYARAGVPVGLACATRGEMGRNMGKPPFATRESLPEIRERELAAACALLGIRDVWLLGVWDKTAEFRDPEALADQVAAILAEVRPSLVLTSHPEHGGHPDHCAVGEAAIRAVRRLPPAERPQVHCSIPPRLAEKAGIPLHTVDVRAVLDIKQAAIRAHRSQSEGMLSRLSPEEAERRREQMASERYMVYPV